MARRQGHSEAEVPDGAELRVLPQPERAAPVRISLHAKDVSMRCVEIIFGRVS